MPKWLEVALCDAGEVEIFCILPGAVPIKARGRVPKLWNFPSLSALASASLVLILERDRIDS